MSTKPSKLIAAALAVLALAVAAPATALAGRAPVAPTSEPGGGGGH